MYATIGIILGIIIVIIAVVIAKKNHRIPSRSSFINDIDSVANEMILQWVYHLLYTRLVVMAFFGCDSSTGCKCGDSEKLCKCKSNALPELSARLMQNQRDIGNLFGQKFSPSIGDDIIKALTEHIQIAVEVLTAVKSGGDAKTSLAKFYKNANEIGQYLDKLLNTNTMTHHMKMHIDDLVANVLAYKSNRSTRDDILTLDKYIRAGVNMGIDITNAMTK